jgi:hypothetical protein
MWTDSDTADKETMESSEASLVLTQREFFVMVIFVIVFPQSDII